MKNIENFAPKNRLVYTFKDLPIKKTQIMKIDNIVKKLANHINNETYVKLLLEEVYKLGAKDERAKAKKKKKKKNKIDISKLKTQIDYLGGINFMTHETRDYMIEITNTKLRGTKIRKSTYKKRISQFEWGVQENEYWVDGDEKNKYQSLKELIKSINKA